MNFSINSPIISLSALTLQSGHKNRIVVDKRPFYSLIYRRQGVRKFYFGKECITSYPGSILYIPARLGYVTEVIEDTDNISIHFQTLESSSAVPFLLDNTNPALPLLFDQILQSYSTMDDKHYKCYSYFYKLLAELDKEFHKEKIVALNPIILRAKSQIEKNFSDKNFNIELLVRDLSISASHLRSEFKKNFSLTPIEYLQHVRLQHALSLLSTQYYSINEIAEKSGYSSTSYFIQVFQHHFGCSPRKYREKFMYK